MEIDGVIYPPLKPCPFCGRIPKFERIGEMAYVKCPNCGAESDKKGPPKTQEWNKELCAIKAWNQRVPRTLEEESYDYARKIIPDPVFVMMKARAIPDAELLDKVVLYTEGAPFRVKMFVFELVHRFKQMDYILYELKLEKKQFADPGKMEGQPDEEP